MSPEDLAELRQTGTDLLLRFENASFLSDESMQVGNEGWAEFIADEASSGIVIDRQYLLGFMASCMATVAMLQVLVEVLPRHGRDMYASMCSVLVNALHALDMYEELGGSLG